MLYKAHRITPQMRGTLLKHMVVSNPFGRIYNPTLTQNPYRSFSTAKGIGRVTLLDDSDEVDTTGIPAHALDVLEPVTSETRMVLPKQLEDPIITLCRRMPNGFLPILYLSDEAG